jgi:hypothetical protein
MNDINYKGIETARAEPEAALMIETFRSIGYTVETAIADIVDNSITAKARNVWIDYLWRGRDTILAIADDGIGLNNADLIHAMKPGCMPTEGHRSSNDLGRFGLGLKTASFSQCRKFCVYTKKASPKPVFWAWDLDYVNNTNHWDLIRYIPDCGNLIERINKQDSGTAVIWWDLDRLTQISKRTDDAAKAAFLKTMEIVKAHLGMVFHRFISNGFNIHFQQRKVAPWDPIMIGAAGLQPRPTTSFENGKILVRGYVLPHRSKLSADEYEDGKGPKDSWTSHQGFYIYRNQRLLVAGDWLGLFKKEVHYDLCRICIDLPSEFDSDWQIDIKKAVARPPILYRSQIEAVAKEARAKAVEVYRHRGKILKRDHAKDEYFPLWQEAVRGGKRFYRINRAHPLVKALVGKRDESANGIERLLKFVEETIPVPLIMVKENENQDDLQQGKPFENEPSDLLIHVMRDMYKALCADGFSPALAKARISNIEPFDFYLEQIERLDHE